MCAATSQMVAKVAELMELRKMIEDLNAEAELIADEIKAYMGEESILDFIRRKNDTLTLAERKRIINQLCRGLQSFCLRHEKPVL